jgi:hypothetical protein
VHRDDGTFPFAGLAVRLRLVVDAYNAERAGIW